MEIYYFAAARAARGLEREERAEVPGTLDELLRELAAEAADAAGPGLRLAEVLERCTFLLDGRRSPREASLEGVGRLDILPPFAGG
ncbi:MoaD/ThiS family protein [Corynebacterium uropygiale]|uniref:MoaD/ThiS family protein n=1 Tax=Corynebacterium uropygiale TaxID=1775911 RepID=A0A9X1QN29_9CORY|nr:MoaD/ThiS family protein [Corynebacterium uropygiale]MCF4005656.1 MoaD/ThiS family protein [Corynebacterium uropygiale]